MKKVSFKKVPCELIDGTVQHIDMCEVIGNGIYQKTGDIGLLDVARDIYYGKEVDLTGQLQQTIEVNILPELTAVAKVGVQNLINNNGEEKQNKK